MKQFQLENQVIGFTVQIEFTDLKSTDQNYLDMINEVSEFIEWEWSESDIYTACGTDDITTAIGQDPGIVKVSIVGHRMHTPEWDGFTIEESDVARS
jgi:hypothetical protein